MKISIIVLCAILAVPVQAVRAAEEKAGDTARLYLDVKDVEIRDAIQLVSKAHNLNIILDKDVSGTVTLHLSNVPVMEGLRTLAKTRGLEVSREGSVYRIGFPSQQVRTSVSFEKGLLTADVQNMAVEEFIRSLSAAAGINIVTEGRLGGTISGRLTGVSIESGLRALLESNGFRVHKSKDIYRVLPGGAASAQSPYRIQCIEGTVTLDVSNVELAEVVKEIARQSGLEIITYGEIFGKVNATLVDVPLAEIFALLLGGTPFTYIQNGNLVMIGNRDATTPSGIALSTSEIVPLAHLKADEVLKILPKNIPEANVRVFKERNALLVTGTSEDIVKTKLFLQKIDEPVPQVVIDAIVVEYSRQGDLNVGLNIGSGENVKEAFSFPGLSVAGNVSPSAEPFKGWNMRRLLGPLANDFYFKLRLLEEQGKARVLARPSITVLNGNKATIDVGQTQYFKIQTGTPENPISRFEPISFGIKLNITPWISSSGHITTEISPEISNAMGLNAENYPNIFRRSVSTTVSLGNGQTLVLGGLLRNEKSESQTRMPLLASIPVLGWAFRSTRRQNTETNLVIYITPRVIDRDGFVTLDDELRKFEELSKSSALSPSLGRDGAAMIGSDPLWNRGRSTRDSLKQSGRRTRVPVNP